MTFIVVVDTVRLEKAGVAQGSNFEANYST
jgi:hypothetical protein